MKNALMKDTFREIKKSFGRFVSILSIVALSVAFFSGLKLAPIDMKKTADSYYDDYNFMDIMLASTFGLNNDDINAIKSISEVEGVYGTNSMDVVTKYESKEIVLKLHSLPLDKIPSDNSDYINRVNLIEGRLPQNPDECVIENNNLKDFNIPLGTTLTLSSGTSTPLSDSLSNTEFKIVGKVETPYYISYEKGTSKLGDGKIKTFLMIPQEDFKVDIYSEAFVTVKNTKTLNSYEDEYFNIIDSVSKKIEELSKERISIRYNEVKQEATDKLEKEKENFNIQKSEAKSKLAKGEKDLKSSELKIKKGTEELLNKESSFNNFIIETEDKIKKSEEDLKKAEEEYETGINAFNQSLPIIEDSFKKQEIKIDDIEKNIKLLEDKISALNKQLNNENISYDEKNNIDNKIKDIKIQLETTIKELNIKNNELIEQKNSHKSTSEKLRKTKSIIESSKKSLLDKKSKFKESKNKVLSEINRGKEELNNGKLKLAQGKKDYEAGKIKAKEEISKAEKDIVEAENKIKDIEKPKWFILDRKSHYSYVDYGNAANSIDALAKIFPVFFFLVAALVCLTTITRMVDEQRITIGTLKALGYSKVSIASKYIFYALLACIIGSLIGLAIGFTVFPQIIFDAYGIMYILPPIKKAFESQLAVGITFIGVLITTLSAYLACSKELKESPSILMRPKSPQNGKRILLERFTFIWKRLNFTSKITLRNIFRYKKRFFMTVFGISGCTALLLTGFGIKDSIKTIVNSQFGTIFKYDMTINLNKDINLDEKTHIIDYIEKDCKLSKYEFINSQNGKASSHDIEKQVTIIVPENIKSIDSVIHLENRKTKDILSINDSGVILTEKLANQLNAKVGSKIELLNNNNEKIKVNVSGIAENYLSNYVYVSPNYYKEKFHSSLSYNEIIISIDGVSVEVEEDLTKDLAYEPGVIGLSFTSGIKNNFNNTIKSLGYVVLVMITSAGALAFVVLYNLTNVNISERLREIATLKVLGFYDNEVSAYIYRENLILTFIGSIVGLGLGVLLHRFIMITVELDNLMFGRSINISSFIISIILTVSFAILVNLAMYYKLKYIKMVESLKSVD